MRKEMKPFLLGAAVLTLTGCVAGLCPEDRQLLKQAIEANRSAAVACTRQPVPPPAAGAAPMEVAPMAGGETAATPTAASRPENGTALENAVQRAELAAERAQLAAERAEMAAELARKAFDSGLKK